MLLLLPCITSPPAADQRLPPPQSFHPSRQCTYFVGEARVCHARINKGDHMLKYLRNLDALGVRKDDVWEFNIGLW